MPASAYEKWSGRLDLNQRASASKADEISQTPLLPGCVERHGSPVPLRKGFNCRCIRDKKQKGPEPFGSDPLENPNVIQRSGVGARIIGDDADLSALLFHTELEYVLH